jgi:cell division inhibitor SepF
MGISDKFKKLMGIDEEFDDDDLDDDEDLETKSIIPEEKTPVMTSSAPAAPKTASGPSSSSSRPQTATSKFTANNVKLVVMEPQSFDESPRLVDLLKAKKPVIINLENLETDVARKIFDFLSGATYALNGNVQKIANNIFVFAPENVDVTYNNGARASEQPVVKSPWNR